MIKMLLKSTLAQLNIGAC